MPIRLISLAITLIVVLALAPAAVAAPTTYTVDSTGNGADFTPGDGLCAATGGCTLRAAIEESNASSGGVPHRINFFVNQISIPPGGLPAITRDGTFIDGCDVDPESSPAQVAGVERFRQALLKASPAFQTAVGYPPSYGGAEANGIATRAIGLRFGAVVDFVQWHVAGHYWPAFNVADSAITVGAVLLVFGQLTATGSKENAR